VRRQRTFSRSDFNDDISLLGTGRCGDLFEHGLAGQKVLTESSTQVAG
jgi:hypothetical protein